MQDHRIDLPCIVSFTSAGFHKSTFDLAAVAIEQYVSRAGLPVYRALIRDKEIRRGQRALCGMPTCQCGSALNVIGSEGGDCWIEITPEMLSSHTWDEVMHN